MTMPQFAVGIDLGTACGWAVLDYATGKRLASGTWDCSIRRGEGAGFRVIRLRGFLTELLKAYPGSVVFYEAIKRHLGTQSAHAYGELRGALYGLLDAESIPYAGIPVGTIKREATGKGAASKDAMIAAAYERWQVETVDDNEADALWVAETGRQGKTS